MELIFVRHGESIWNADGRWQGQSDVPLSAGGREEIVKVARRLEGERFDRIVSSDLSRAFETAVAIAGPRAAEIEREPALREMNLGAWCGLPHVEVETRFKEELRALARGEPMRIGGDGETLPEFGARVLGAVDRIVRDSAVADRVLVVTHGGVVRAMMVAMLGLVGRHRPLVGSTNTALTRIEASPEGARTLRVYNDDRHLGRDDPSTDTTLEPGEAKARVIAHLGLDPGVPIADAAPGSHTRVVEGRHPQLRRYAIAAG